jgi:Na+-translocating ferredoxin:NAD+ oxidoreductase RNF subunit RnfB/anti-sigma regulatory factor (Ser/Thr protein kinase)
MMEFVSYDIASNDFRRAGAASRAIKEHLKRIGAEAEAIRRTMIAAYEAEMNVVIHSVGGRLDACLSDSQIDVNVVDGGPGIPDVDLAMTEGYSTASAEARALGFGAGMGLPNIKRNSDRLRITSRPNEGTRVSFTVYLQPESTRAARIASLYASADRCRDCRACLTACPTQAMRVRDGRPSVLEHLCVECAECICACATGALGIRDEYTSLEDIKGREEMLLVVPPGLLAGCGPKYQPAQVLAALRGLGFADVITSAPFEEALVEAAGRAATGSGTATAAAAVTGATEVTTAQPATQAGTVTGTREAQPAGATGSAGPDAGPVIIPSCPAIVNLVELRFPSLVPYLAPFDSQLEAVQATYGDRPVAYVVTCPSQRSALLAHAQAGEDDEPPVEGPGEAEYLVPEVVRQAVMMRLTGGERVGGDPDSDGVPAGEAAPGTSNTVAATTGKTARDTTEARDADTAASPSGAEPQATTDDAVLTVTGIDHVMAVLEGIENGQLDDIIAIEPYACAGGCFGSPLLSEDYHVAARRWREGRAAVEMVPATAVPRRRPYAPRPGIRLDADMATAIQKLTRMQEVIHLLPGRDCGACGAPTCAALAEDVVMERARTELCPYIAPENKIAAEEKEVVER